ncbi:MAG: allantoinase AllB [Bacteroidia bacterium]|nr:allantoinase AllB [Bacteroidia bacterium]
MGEAIYSQNVLLPAGLRPATLEIKDGKIAAIHPEQRLSGALDLGTLVLMPGLIDSHVHINEPGRTDWEGMLTATRAAAAGGITTLVDMPLNSLPVTTTAANFQEKLQSVKGKLQVNCGFWGGIVPENADQMEPLLEAGVLGIKAFLCHSGIDEFPNVTEGDLRKGMPAIARAGVPLLVHAELVADHPHINQSKAQPHSYAAWLASRPNSWEDEAIGLMIRLCHETGARTHIVHLASASALPMLRTARAAGLPLTVETCPHYLWFFAENIPDGQPVYKCAPPIREKSQRDALREALKSGELDFVVTDHSPAPAEIKNLDTGNLAEAWGGIASVQFSLPITWTILREMGMQVEDLAKLMSGNIARFLNLGHQKGALQVGQDADLVAWDPEEAFILQKEMIEYRHPISPYLGSKLFGTVHKTWVNGKLVYDEGVFPNPGSGEIILRQKS